MGEVIEMREYMEVRSMTKLELEARREYLEGYMSLMRQIRETSEELVAVEHDIGPGASIADGMPRSGKISDGSDRIIGRMETKRRLCAGIRRDIARLEKDRDEIAEVIRTTSQGKLQEVLRYRYIQGMKLREIAEVMHYSERQVQNLIDRATQRIKPPKRVIQRIKAELAEEHTEWANQAVKRA